MAKKGAALVVQVVDEQNDVVSDFAGAGGGGGGLTDTELRATPVPVSGTVTTSGLTDAQLRATAVPVSGTVTASGPLTDAQLRATAVPVSGTVTASGPLTDAQLRATAVPISVATIPSHAVTNAGTFAVQATDSGGSLTVDAPVGTPVFVRLSDGTTAIATLPVSLASVPSHAVTNAGTFAVQETGTAYSTHRSIDLDEGTLEVVKASPGTVYAMWVTNTATTTRWIKFYDATSGTAGTGTPKITIGIAGNATDDITGNFGPGGKGIAFATGICVGATTGVADADTGAPSANDVIVNIFFV